VKKVGFFMLNLGLVYFLEYMCLTSFAERIVAKINLDHPERKDDYLFKHGYVVFTFCYQIGVFLSRSSLSIVKIKRVEIMTILQAINAVFFLLNTIFLFLENFYVMFVLMFWVGLMGGSSYVNVMYNILESEKLAKNEKELALTLTGVGNDIGILLASLLSLLLANTAFKY
jgi:battenin